MEGSRKTFGKKDFGDREEQFVETPLSDRDREQSSRYTGDNLLCHSSLRSACHITLETWAGPFVLGIPTYLLIHQSHAESTVSMENSKKLTFSLTQSHGAKKHQESQMVS